MKSKFRLVFARFFISSWMKKGHEPSRAELKILQLELWLEPARLGLITTNLVKPLKYIHRYFILAYSKLTFTALQYKEAYFCEEILSAANICLKLKAPLIYGTLFRTPQKKIGIRESHCSNSYDFKKNLASFKSSRWELSFELVYFNCLKNVKIWNNADAKVEIVSPVSLVLSLFSNVNFLTLGFFLKIYIVWYIEQCVD